MLPHLLTNFQIQNYYQNEPKSNGSFSSNNLPKLKDEAYVINNDEYRSTGIHWIALFVNVDNITYFDSLGVEHTPKEIKKLINNKNISTSIFRMQAYNSMMSGYFCIGFNDLIPKGKILLDYTNLFSPNEYEKKTW